MKRIRWLLSASIILLLTISIGGCGQQASTASTQAPSQAENKAVLPIEKEKSGIKVKLTRVEQDSTSLKIYVTYTNNTKDQMLTCINYAKIVANGKQFDSDVDLTLDQIEKLKLPHAGGSLEPGVTAEDIILFSPVKDTDKINIALYPDGQRFGFDNIPIINK